MLTKELFRSLAAIVALLGVTSTTSAQLQQVGSRLGQNAPLIDGSETGFLANDLQSYDGQVFTPLDFGEQSVKERFDNTGLFFTYDRASLYVTAPETTTVAGQSAPGFNYQTWGNRFETGYMSEEDKGFTATLLYTGGSTFLAGRSDVGIPAPMHLDSGYTSFEINRTYRQCLKSGALFEPYFGFRYLGVTDKTNQDGSVSVLNPFLGTSNRFLQEAQNVMPGGQVGFRLFRQTDRWTLSGNFSAMALYNNQTYFASDIVTRVQQPNIVVERAFDNEEFVPAVEGRFDVAYHLTRDIAVRAGGQVTYLVQGLTRANVLQAGVNPNSIQSGTAFTNSLTAGTDQDSVLAGFTMGIEWRR